MPVSRVEKTVTNGFSVGLTALGEWEDAIPSAAWTFSPLGYVWYYTARRTQQTVWCCKAHTCCARKLCRTGRTSRTGLTRRQLLLPTLPLLTCAYPKQHGRAAAIAASAATLRLYAPHERLLHYTDCSVTIRNHPYKIAVYTPLLRAVQYGWVRISTERYGATLNIAVHSPQGLKAKQKSVNLYSPRMRLYRAWSAAAAFCITRAFSSCRSLRSFSRNLAVS